MLRIQLGSIINKTTQPLELFQFKTLADFPGKELAQIEPLQTIELNTELDLEPLRGHQGGRASLVLRNKMHPEKELAMSILWAEQEEGLGFFIDIRAQNRLYDTWTNLEGLRIDTILPKKDEIMIFDMTIEGDSFENSSVSARLIAKS